MSVEFVGGKTPRVSYCKNGNGVSIRQAVFSQLDKNPLLTPKSLCKLLGLSYAQYRNYVTKLRNDWKYYHRNGRVPKVSSVHCWRGWTYVPRVLDRVGARGCGWRLSRGRNRMLIWRDALGCMHWFETGRVNLRVRKPANYGKVCQLVCNGFSWTGLIKSDTILEVVLKGIRFKGAHEVFETGERLPHAVIDKYTRSNGIIIRVGDRTHPTSVEVEYSYMDWAERNERILTQFLELLKGMTGEAPGDPLNRKNVTYVA